VTDERLLDAAAGLFYRQGIVASGVDAVATCSGISKPTLYARFGTKAGLVTAVLQRHHERRRLSLEAHLRARAGLSARDRLVSVFDWVAAQHTSQWQRGCPFVNAAVELGRPDDAPAREVIQAHKHWFRSVLTELAIQAGATEPEIVASQLHLLVEGANARMLAEQDRDAITTARRAAEALFPAGCVAGERAGDQERTW
jgi:AcrR family transcriptional regulator